MVGLSARALSQSARSAGYAPLAADFFCDLDTQEAAEQCERVDGNLARGFEWQPLARALDCLAANREPLGVVCGSGFEDRPELLDRIAGRWPLLGNSGATVARTSDPATLAELCAKLGIPHPRWSGRPQNAELADEAGRRVRRLARGEPRSGKTGTLLAASGLRASRSRPSFSATERRHSFSASVRNGPILTLVRPIATAARCAR